MNEKKSEKTFKKKIHTKKSTISRKSDKLNFIQENEHINLTIYFIGQLHRNSKRIIDNNALNVKIFFLIIATSKIHLLNKIALAMDIF